MQEPRASAEANPYAAPEVAAPPLAPAAVEEGRVTPRMVLLMRQSAPWVFFLSVIGFLFTGLFGLGMLTNFMLGFLTFDLELSGLIAMATIVLVIVAGVVLSALLFRYGLSVLRFVSTHSVAELCLSRRYSEPCGERRVQRDFRLLALAGFSLSSHAQHEVPAVERQRGPL